MDYFLIFICGVGLGLIIAYFMGAKGNEIWRNEVIGAFNRGVEAGRRQTGNRHESE